MFIEKIIIFVFVYMKFVCVCVCVSNNVCSSLKDYQNLENNPNCWFDPDVNASPKDIAARYGYPFETHEVVSKDFYVTTLFRVPHNGAISNEKRRPVLLHHGFMVDSLIFMLMGNQSLVFMLSNNGYDVWLSNCRGSNYSPKHLNLTDDDPKYWNFGLHEIAIYDIPVIVEYISKVTGQEGQLAYIAHSMGTSISYIYASVKPYHAKKYLRKIVSLAPIGHNTHASSPVLKTLSNLKTQIWDQFTSMNIYGTRPKLNPVVDLLQSSCTKYPTIALCASFLDIASGKHEKSVLQRIYPMIFAHNPSGFSLQTLIHLLQFFGENNRFEYYDFGPEKNRKVYKSATPPEYPVWKIKVPVHLFYGDLDSFMGEKDVENLYNKLQTEKSMTKLYNFAHTNFAVAQNVTKLYEMIINVIK